MYIVFQNTKTREIFARNIECITQKGKYMEIKLSRVEKIIVCAGETHAMYEGYYETYFECEILQMEPEMATKEWGKLSIGKGDI